MNTFVRQATEVRVKKKKKDKHVVNWTTRQKNVLTNSSASSYLLNVNCDSGRDSRSATSRCESANWTPLSRCQCLLKSGHAARVRRQLPVTHWLYSQRPVAYDNPPNAAGHLINQEQCARSGVLFPYSAPQDHV